LTVEPFGGQGQLFEAKGGQRIEFFGPIEGDAPDPSLVRNS